MFFLLLWFLFWCWVPSLTTFTRKISQLVVWGKQWLRSGMPLARASKKMPTMPGYALRSELKLRLRFTEV
jgi:hypothetical protein